MLFRTCHQPLYHPTWRVCWACSATVRPFRLVAATAVMQLVTSMIRVMSTLEDAQNTAQRQLEAEQKRKGNKVSAGQPTACCVVVSVPCSRLPGGVYMACGTLDYPDSVMFVGRLRPSGPPPSGAQGTRQIIVWRS